MPGHSHHASSPHHIPGAPPYPHYPPDTTTSITSYPYAYYPYPIHSLAYPSHRAMYDDQATASRENPPPSEYYMNARAQHVTPDIREGIRIREEQSIKSTTSAASNDKDIQPESTPSSSPSDGSPYAPSLPFHSYRESPPESTRSSLTVASPPSVARTRNDASLVHLSKKFVNVLRNSPGQKLDLNMASIELGVQKRRIYDITNVLEGIGLISKDGKNNVTWNNIPQMNPALQSEPDGPSSSDRVDLAEDDCNPDLTSATSIQKAQDEIFELAKEEQEIICFLEFLTQQSLHFLPFTTHREAPRHPGYMPKGIDAAWRYMFVRYSDITGIDTYGADNIIGITSPTGTSLEVPDPEQGMTAGTRRYQMFLNSRCAHPAAMYSPGRNAINVYLIRPDGIPANKEDSRLPVGNEENSTPATSTVSKKKTKKKACTKKKPVKGGYVDNNRTPTIAAYPSHPNGSSEERTSKLPYAATHYHDSLLGSQNAHPPMPQDYHERSWGPPSAGTGPVAKKARQSLLKSPPRYASVYESPKKSSPTKYRSTPERGDKEEFYMGFDQNRNGDSAQMDFAPTPTRSRMFSSPIRRGPASPLWSIPTSTLNYPGIWDGFPSPFPTFDRDMRPPLSPMNNRDDLFGIPLNSPGSRGQYPPGYFLSPSIPDGFSPPAATIRSPFPYALPPLQCISGEKPSSDAFDLDTKPSDKYSPGILPRPRARPT